MRETGTELLFSVDGTFAPWPGFGGLIERCVMPLFTIVEGQFRHIGTGFIISHNGLMMTAKHVLEEGQRYRTRRLNNNGEYYDHWELYALYTTDRPNDDPSDSTLGGLIPIDLIYCPEALDIALSWLKPLKNVTDDSQLTFPQIGLSARMPRVGEKIVGCGYHGSALETTRTNEGVLVDYDRKTAVSSGTIIELHPSGRDAGMLTFPCFRTDTRFESGMSGGPIFCEDGYVCGVICSSMAPTEDDSSYLSYGSWIKPAFGIQMEAIIEPNTVVEKMLLYDFAKKGFVETDESFDLVRLKEDES